MLCVLESSSCPENAQDNEKSLNTHPTHAIASLFVQLLLVESQLLTLQDVTVTAAGLTGTAGDNGVQTTGLELLLNSGLDLAVGGVASSLLLLNGLALLDLLDLLALLGGLGLLASTADGLAVVGLVPLSERSSVDLDDGATG